MLKNEDVYVAEKAMNKLMMCEFKDQDLLGKIADLSCRVDDVIKPITKVNNALIEKYGKIGDNGAMGIEASDTKNMKLYTEALNNHLEKEIEFELLDIQKSDISEVKFTGFEYRAIRKIINFI